MKRSVFVNLTARNDGGEQHRAYAELMDLAELAEAFSYETFWLTEHHSPSAGATPDPFGLLSAIASRTSTLRLGTAARLVGLTEPLLLAEAAAQLDTLAGGRLELGLARGFNAGEFEAAGRDLPTPASFLAAAARVRALLHGADLLPRPMQSAAPVWLAASSSETMRFAAEAKFPILTNHYFLGSRERFAAMVRAYRTIGGEDARVLAHLLVYVAPNRAEARTEGLRVIDEYLAMHANGTGITAADLVGAGLVAVGCPSAVAETLHWLESLGVDEVAINPLVGLHPLLTTRRSLALIGNIGRIADGAPIVVGHE